MSPSELAENILSYVKESGQTATVFFKAAGIDRFRGYDIINGARVKDRDELLRLSIAMNLSPDKTQALLNASGFPVLDKDDGRDSTILFALRQGGDMDGLNEALQDLGYDRIR